MAYARPPRTQVPMIHSGKFEMSSPPSAGSPNFLSTGEDVEKFVMSMENGEVARQHQFSRTQSMIQLENMVNAIVPMDDDDDLSLDDDFEQFRGDHHEQKEQQIDPALLGGHNLNLDMPKAERQKSSEQSRSSQQWEPESLSSGDEADVSLGHGGLDSPQTDSTVEQIQVKMGAMSATSDDSSVDASRGAYSGTLPSENPPVTQRISSTANTETTTMIEKTSSRKTLESNNGEVRLSDARSNGTVGGGLNNDVDDDDDYASDHSVTTAIPKTQWKPLTADWEDIDIRVEDDDFEDKKPAAEEFRSLHFFFRFLAERLRDRDVILKSTLPDYDEWKSQRKQRIAMRNTAVKGIDKALEACHHSLEMMATIVRNSILLCRDNTITQCQPMKFDPHDWYQADFADFEEAIFSIGKYSAVSAWNLFSFATHGCISKEWWETALHDDHPAKMLMQAEPDEQALQLLGQTDQYRPAQIMVWNKVSFLSNMCISEYLENHSKELGFGSKLPWTTIRQEFENRKNQKYLNAFARHVYIINPSVDDLTHLIADRDDAHISRNKILAEPLVWLMYLVHFIIDRQKKLVNLAITTEAWKDTVTFTTSTRVKMAVENLNGSAKQELNRLNEILAKLPSIEDLQETFEKEIQERDPRRMSLYGTTPLAKGHFKLSNQTIATVKE